jgi:peptide chain release factor 2
MQDQIKQLEALLTQIQDATKRLNVTADETRVSELGQQTQAPGFWDDAQAAGVVSQQLAGLKRHVEDWQQLQQDVTEALEIARLGDESLAGEVMAAYDKAAADFAAREFELKLSGPYDKNTALVSIYAGTGGTDAQDWAEMLLRMYLRFAEKNGWVTQILDQSPGEEAGIKSVTVEVTGTYAYGKLKSEKGVHRLVRLSPYNADNLRQTSFALVDVLPELDNQQDIEIDPKDLRIDVYRSGGNGGQSVNTTDSAVRITHISTGTVVAIQNERSQLQNKEKAMAILKARLMVLMLEQQKAEVSQIRGATQSAAWGNQIRSYILHPYTKVKDHRTGFETSQAQAVLDGDLDGFIEAYLQTQIGK